MVSGVSSVGGLVGGLNSSTIENSYATGEVSEGGMLAVLLELSKIILVLQQTAIMIKRAQSKRILIRVQE